MIPRALITEWAASSPWRTDADVEQDLILSRLMVEIANDALLGDELVMRGGTCLHKLHLPRPLRYSEDLDYVRRTHSAVGPFLDALRALTADIGLRLRTREQTYQMVHMTFETESTDGLRPIRIKVEMNVRETDSCFPRITRPYRVTSGWWSGEAGISTFDVDELMGTKLRALYQRSKGRDLFDLWYVLSVTDADDERIVQALDHYMRGEVFAYSVFVENLREKLAAPTFLSDIADLVAAPPTDYRVDTAADLVMERLGARLPRAPALDEIRDGRWRRLTTSRT